MAKKPNSCSSTKAGDNIESAQQNLREKERQLRVLTDHLPGHIAYVGAHDLRYHFVNQNFESSFGRPREEIIGKHIRDIIGESNYEYALKYIAEVRAGKSTSYVNVFNLVQGQRWIKVNYAPDLDEQGNVKGIIVLSYDISELKQAEEDVRNSERRFADIINFLPDATFVIDIERKVVAWNRALEKLTGIKAQVILGKGNYQYAIPFYGIRRPVLIDLALDWNDEIAKTYQYVKKEGDTLVSETRNPPFRPGSSLFWNSARPLYDAHGEVIGAIEVIRDITERMRSEEALQKSERLYRSLFENTGTATFVAEDDFTISQVNAKCEELMGYSREEIEGQMKTTDFVTPEDLEQVVNYNLARRELIDETPSEFEFNMRNRQGDVKTVFIQTGIIPETRQSIASIIDITPRKKMESQLQQAQRMESIGRLAGGIAHDFNNLLMGIQGNASLILSDIDNSHFHYQRLNNIEKYVKNGSELTKQLLGFARGGKYEVKPTDLNPLIEKSAVIFGRTKKEIRIHKKYQKEIWMVEIDKSQIEQVLLNLYVNAWQAMPGGGDLYIQTENEILDEGYVNPHDIKPGRYVKISITDTGIGMDAVTQQRIFDPFFTTKEKDRGTGLGLASAYGIVNNHGGIIRVYSEQGEGTTFNIHLPVTDKRVSQQQRKDNELIGGSEVLLLVDDEELILEIGKDLMEKLGYQVITAPNGRKALEIYKRDQNKIDMVILDMIMPDMSGGETYKQLKEINPSIKTLLSSGYSINGKAQAILNNGCSGFIQKPFNLKDLSQKIREILGQK